jgi:protein tyrosine kinase modulator
VEGDSEEISMLGHRPLSAAEYPGIWRRRRKWALLCVLLGLAGGYALARTLPAKYTSTATVRQDEGAANHPVAGSGPELSSERLVALREQVLTPERLQALASRWGLYPAEKNEGSVDAPAVQMSRNIALAPSTMGFTISFTADDARVAQQVCAAIAGMFTEPRTPDNGVSPAGLMDGQVKDAKRKLDTQEAKLAAFQHRHGGEPSAGDEEATRNSLMEYNVQLEAANRALQRALQERTTLTEASPAAEPPNVQALEQEMATEQAQLVTLEARYTPDHPDVVKLKTDISRLQKKIDDAKRAAAPKKSGATPAVESPQVAQMRAQVQGLDRTIQEETAEQSRLQGEIRAARARLENSAALERESRQLTLDRDAARTNYNTLLAKQSELMKATEIERRREQSAFRLAEEANLPISPSFPDPILFTLGGAGGGLGVGLLVVVLGEMRDKTLRTEDDIEHYLGLPTLAVIPPADAPGDKITEGRGRFRAVRSASGEKGDSVLADV